MPPDDFMVVGWVSLEVFADLAAQLTYLDDPLAVAEAAVEIVYAMHHKVESRVIAEWLDQQAKHHIAAVRIINKAEENARRRMP